MVDGVLDSLLLAALTPPGYPCSYPAPVPATSPDSIRDHAPGEGARSSTGSPRGSRALRVLAVWVAATLVTFVLARLGAQDTPATPWGGASPSWQEHLAFWDSGWYERIAREGYPTTLPVGADGTVSQNAWAFMPMLPWLAGLLSWTGLGFYVRAALVSLIASAGAAVIMDRWLEPRVGGRVSLWGVALAWSAAPALVLQVPYAESLGLLLVGSVMLLADRRLFLWAVPLVLLAALARPVGVPLAAGLGLWWLLELLAARSDGSAWSARLAVLLPGDARLSGAERVRLLALTAVSALSALAWPVIAWVTTGRSDAYTASETAWRGTSLTPFLPWLDRGGWWAGDHLGPILLLGVLALTALALAAPAARRLGAAAWCWCVGYVLYLLAFFDPTASLIRVLLPLAPLGWAAASSVRSRRARLALLAAGVVAQVLWISWVWDLGTVSVQWVP